MVLHRLEVGDARVTALRDGHIDIPLAAFPGAGRAEAAALLHEAGRSPPVRAALNAFLVQARGRTVLIDTGGGSGLGPTAGRLQVALDAAGVTASRIDAVALTHLHPDHVNGLLAPDGKAAFPNAELVLHGAEHAFWTDEGAHTSAPEDMRPFFGAARAGIAPYAGRTRLLDRADEPVAPGLTAVPLPGHTPGHVGYLVASGAGALLV